MRANRINFHILGRDFSGTVSAIGDGVRDIRVGDEVFGVCDVGHAEDLVLHAPRHLYLGSRRTRRQGR